MEQKAWQSMASQDGVLKACMAEIQAAHGKIKEPPTLFHYTTDFALHSIIASGVLRISDITALNDPTEVRHGIAPAVAAFDGIAANGSPVVALAREIFSTLPQNMEKIAYFNVISFSMDGDDLGQWRAYAQDGRGFALGFETKALVRAFMEQQRSEAEARGTFPLLYDDAMLVDLQTRLVTDAIERLNRVSEVPAQDREQFLGAVTMEVASNVLHLALHFKHPAYKHEQEFRMLVINPAVNDFGPCQWHSRGLSLVRNLELTWRAAGVRLSQIIVGPSADIQVSTAFLDRCGATYGLSGWNVTQSAIPYRAR